MSSRRGWEAWECWRCRRPAPPSRPAATTVAAAARATTAAGGGAAGSARGAAGAGGAGGAAGSTGGAAGAGAARGGQQRSLPLSDDPTLQQLHEWVIQRGIPGGGGFGFMWPQRPRVCASQRCVPGYVEAATLGSSNSAAAPGSGEFAAALGARESADALGASASTTTGPASAEALHTFTLDSGASRCFFRDCTTVTPLAAPVPVSLANPTGGPVVARASTFLPCPTVPSRSLSGLHLPAFLTNLLSNAVLQDEWVDTFIPRGQGVAIYKCSRTSRHLATFTCQPGSGLYTPTTASAQVAESDSPLARLCHPTLPHLRSMHSRLLVSGLPRSLPSLPRSPTPPCLPCVEGRQRVAPHSSEFPPTTAPLQTLHMDIWGPAPVGGMDKECYFLLVVDDYTRYTTVFPLRRKADVSVLRLHSDRGGKLSSNLLAEFCQDEGIRQSSTWPRVSEKETSPTLRWTGKVGDALVFRVWGALSLVRDAKASKLSSCTLRYVFLGFPTDAPPWQFYHPRSRRVFSSEDVTFDESVCFYRLHPHVSHRVDPPPLVEALEISSDSSGPAEGGDPAADDTAATHHSPHLETPPGFPPRPSLPPPQPAVVDSGAETAGAEPRGAETEGEGSGGVATRGVAIGGAGSGGAATRGADSGGAEIPSGGGAVGDPAGGPRAGQPPQPDLLETLSPQAIRVWIVRRSNPGGGGYGLAGAGAASPEGTAGAGGTGGTAGGVGGAVGARGTRGATVAGGAGATSPRGATGAGGAGPTSPGGTADAGGAGGAAGAGGAGAGGTGGAGAAGPRGARTGGAGAAGAGGALSAGGVVSAGGAGGTRAAGTGGAGATGAGAARAAGPGGARTRGTRAAEAGGAASAGGATGVARTGGAGAAGPGGDGAGGTRGAGAAGPGGARTRCAGAVRAGGAASAGGAGGATGAASTGCAGGTAGARGAGAAGARSAASAGAATGAAGAGGAGATDQSQPQLLPGSPLPAPAPHTEVTGSLTERREPETRASTPVRARRVTRPRPPAVPGTHGMALRPSSVPQHVVLPQPPASSLPHVPDPESNLARAASPTVPRLLTTVVADPDFESTAAFALVTKLVDFAARSRLDYVASLVTESESVCPPSVGGEGALSSDVLEDRQFELECLAAALPCFASMLLFPEGDPDALDIPTRALTLRRSRAPREWHNTLRTTLAALGFAPSSADPSLLLDAAKRVLRYLCNTSGMGLVLGGRGSVVLTRHFDISWAGDQATQGLSQGYTFSLHSGFVSWRSTRSTSVLGSSCEAEIYAGTMAAQELRWVIYLLTDFGERPRSPPVLYVDNKAMFSLCREQRLEHITKHIALY
ncbi:unnamed protein product [Closterium sp. NIES-54]